MEREIRYRVLEQDKIIAVGSGKTINLSSNGVAFVTKNELPVGAYIELSIAWPALLENRCPLQLIGFGRVLRSAGGTVAATIEQYEFRTLARIVPGKRLVRAKRPETAPLGGSRGAQLSSPCPGPIPAPQNPATCQLIGFRGAGGFLWRGGSRFGCFALFGLLARPRNRLSRFSLPARSVPAVIVHVPPGAFEL